MGVRIDDIGEMKLKRAKILFKALGREDEWYRAVGAAMKRATQSAKTQAGRYAAETYTITKGKFMANTNIGYTIGPRAITLSFAGAVIPLIEFGGTSGGPRGDVRVGPKMGGGAISRAFINHVYGQLGVWERVGRKAYPVEQKYGPSTGHMMQDDTVEEKMVNHIEEVFDSRIEHEITRILSGW